MSDTEHEPDVHNEFSYVDDSSSRPFDEKVVVVETCFKRNLTRDQIIASLEKEVRKLTKELPLIRQDIAEGFGNLRKNDEQTEKKVAAPLSIIGCEEVHKPSINTTGIAVNEPGKTFDVENSDVVALKLGIDSVVTRLEQAHKKTVDDYEQKIRNKDQDLECMRTMMQALEETVAKKTKDIEKLREKIMDNELEIGKLELSLMNVKTKEQDVKNLKELLQSADVKLQARAKQMEQMGERFTQRITEVITVNDVKQTVNVQAVADLVKTVIVASSTDKMDNIERVPNTSEIVESEIPGEIFVKHFVMIRDMYLISKSQVSVAGISMCFIIRDLIC
jgi:chromosome segregation ATPase